MKLPKIAPTRWYPLRTLLDGDPPDEVRAALSTVGAYVLALFEPNEVPEAVDPADPRVFYIGETHGRTRSLWARLTDFATSAGYYGEQAFGHYAAWRFPEFVAGQTQGRTPAWNTVFVAMYPVPTKMDLPFDDRRGIYPHLAESVLLWTFTDANEGRIPALNNSGRQYRGREFPVLEAPVLEGLFEKDEGGFEQNAETVLTEICKEAGYAVRPFHFIDEDGWRGVGRYVRKREYVYLCRRPTRGGWEVSLWGYDRNRPWFGDLGARNAPAPPRSAKEFAEFVKLFWTRWNS